MRDEKRRTGQLGIRVQPHNKLIVKDTIMGPKESTDSVTYVGLWKTRPLKKNIKAPQPEFEGQRVSAII